MGAKGKKPEQQEPEVNEAELFDDEVAGAESLADLAGTGGGAFDGPLVKMEDIKDRKHQVLDFKFMPSEYREGENYVCIQIKLGGEPMVVNSNAQVIMKGFTNVDKNMLPAPNAFVMRKGKVREYWDFASKDELKKLK